MAGTANPPAGTDLQNAGESALFVIAGTGTTNDGKTVPGVVLLDSAGKIVNVSGSKGSKALTTPSVGTSATLALAANTARKEAVITNPSGTVTVYLGLAGVTVGNFTVALAPGATYIDDSSSDAWYGVVASGTQQLNVTETA